MIECDRERFSQGLMALCVAFRKKNDEPTFEAYWLGLEDVLIDHVLWAMREGMKRCTFFPTVATLRVLSDKARELQEEDDRLWNGRTLPPSPEEEAAYAAGPHELYHCPRCQDTGFEPHTCSKDDPCGNRLCARQGFPGHSYVTFCVCRETNPVLLKQLAGRRKYKKDV